MNCRNSHHLGKFLIRFLIIISLIIPLFIFSGCEDPPPGPIETKLSFSETPLLGKNTEIVFTFSMRKAYESDAHNVTSEILLPDGFELIEGSLEWHGDVLRNQTYTHKATIKAKKTGYWNIEGRSYYSPSPNQRLGGADELYVDVFNDHTDVREHPKKGTSYIEPSYVPIKTNETLPLTPSGASSSKSPMKVKLSFSEPPVLGKSVEITLTFSMQEDYKSDAKNTTARIRFPSEVFDVTPNQLELREEVVTDYAYKIPDTRYTITV